MKTRINNSAISAGPIEGTGYNEYQKVCQVLLDITEWAYAHKVDPIIGLYQEDVPDPDEEDIYYTVNSLVIRGQFEYKGRTVYINYYEASDVWSVSTPIGRFFDIPIEKWDEKLDPSYWADFPVRKRSTRK